MISQKFGSKAADQPLLLFPIKVRVLCTGYNLSNCVPSNVMMDVKIIKSEFLIELTSYCKSLNRDVELLSLLE